MLAEDKRGILRSSPVYLRFPPYYGRWRMVPPDLPMVINLLMFLSAFMRLDDGSLD
jgi:hypothetical protein